MFLEAGSWVSSGRHLLEGPKHGVEVVAPGGHGRVVGAKGRLPDFKRPLNLFSCTFQTRQAVGMDAPEPTAGHPLGHPPGQPSKMHTLLGLLDGASGHQGGRPPRPTAWPDARSSGRVQSSIRAGWPGSTNDERLSPPWAVGCGDDRPLGCPPLGGGPRPGIRVGVQPFRAGAVASPCGPVTRRRARDHPDAAPRARLAFSFLRHCGLSFW